jgi:hypothetical protein
LDARQTNIVGYTHENISRKLISGVSSSCGQKNTLTTTAKYMISTITTVSPLPAAGGCSIDIGGHHCGTDIIATLVGMAKTLHFDTIKPSILLAPMESLLSRCCASFLSICFPRILYMVDQGRFEWGLKKRLPSW